MGVNRGRVLLGGLAGGVVWTIWSFLTGYLFIGMARYEAATNAGLFLKQSRYHFFLGLWIFTLFAMSIVLAQLYSWVRHTMGPGPKTALKLGFLVGFAAGFPLNLAQAAWVPIDRMFPFGWMLDMWVGSILAALVAGWLYKD
jgi:hypothetical protein